MKTRTILLGSAAMALAVSATVAPTQAAHFHGWYVALEGGANWVEDWDHTQHSTVGGVVTDTDPAVASFDTGWAVLASVGYAFDHWRLEVEGGYRKNELDALTSFDPGPSPIAAGDGINEISIMANAIYDFPLTDRLSLSLGAGAGAVRVDLDYQPTPGVNDDEWDFAYQGLAGLSYAIGHRTDLTLNYRYLRVVDPSFDFSPTFGQFLTGDDIVNHTVTVGLRFDLSPDEEPMEAAPPPSPPPAAEPPPAHFVIFFGYNKCNITSEADAVLSEAAGAAKSMGSATVEIVGHTDTSGSQKYNQKLSECRANAAAKNLAGKGVPGSAIHTSGRGETELMVQTGDGVKEPQNRRATVDLH
jgi:OmpA-OmpF porin, OOP family